MWWVFKCLLCFHGALVVASGMHACSMGLPHMKLCGAMPASTFFFAFSCAVWAAFTLFLYSLHSMSAQYMANAALSHWPPDDDANRVILKNVKGLCLFDSLKGPLKPI